jgi:hypothetical protein
MTREMSIDAGYAVASSEPGLGIPWDRDAIEQLRVA